MRLVGRHDLYWLVVITIAVFAIFSRPLGIIIDYAHDLDQGRGLQLLPGLVILTAAFLFHQFRKRQEMRAATAAAAAEARLATSRATEMERLVMFGQARARARSRVHSRGDRGVSADAGRRPRRLGDDSNDGRLAAVDRWQRGSNVNDTHGHLCGDAVLAAVGARMNAVLRGSDLKCRYGGEEFLILLPDTPLVGARRVAETLRRDLEEHPVRWHEDAIVVTGSFGITGITPGEVDTKMIIGRADTAMYRAKEAGRNCICVAEAYEAIV